MDTTPAAEWQVVVVVGAHPLAESLDRPMAERFVDRMRDSGDVPIGLLTDLWCLGQPRLRIKPTVAIGPPERNAVTAALAVRLPTVLLHEPHYRIHRDPDGLDLQACLWGSSVEGQNKALEAFELGHLPDLLESISLRPEGSARSG